MAVADMGRMGAMPAPGTTSAVSPQVSFVTAQMGNPDLPVVGESSRTQGPMARFLLIVLVLGAALKIFNSTGFYEVVSDATATLWAIEHDTRGERR